MLDQKAAKCANVRPVNGFVVSFSSVFAPDNGKEEQRKAEDRGYITQQGLETRFFPASFRFKMADEVEQAVDSTEGNTQNEEASVGRLTQFPQTRVRNMMKIDPDLHLANRESVFLLTKAAVSLNIMLCSEMMGVIWVLNAKVHFR